MALATIAAVVLAALHVVGGHLRSLRAVPRSWLLSAGSGVSVGYVFAHLLPEVAEIQEHLEEQLDGGWWDYLESHAWLMALVGLAVFYGLELTARRRASEASRPHADGDRLVGWVHVASYALYNGVIGYLLHPRAEGSAATLVLFTVAMGLHFLVNDHGLREHHGVLYRRTGRWVVAAGVVVGWALGAVTEISEAGLGLLIAFLAGGVVMNVLKEELPEDRSSRWTPFVFGAAGYAALALLI